MTWAGPLAGVRVIDVTTTMLGPFASLRLAEFGADVIKIETPAGDITRRTDTGYPPGSFLSTNAGKRSVVLDLKRLAHREALYNLVRDADVFLHNVPAPTARRLRIDPESIRTAAGHIVYCAAYGFGEGGPYEGRPAYDDVIQAVSGLAAAQHSADDRPSYISSPIADKTVGLMAAFAIASALVQRARSGIGATIEVPMFEVMASFALQETLGDSAYVPPRGDPGSRVASRFRRPYRTKDGYLSLLLFTDEHWARFLRYIDRPDLIENEQYRSFEARSRNRDVVYASLDELLCGRTTAQWCEVLTALNIPCGPVNDYSDLLDDPHLEAVGFFQVSQDSRLGTVRRPRSGVRFDGAAVDLTIAPDLGQHTASILQGHSIAPADFAAGEGQG